MKKLFYFIVFTIPINLGKHFIVKDSYVHGLLIDYLIPTVYLTDLLIAILLIWWVVTLIKSRKPRYVTVKSPVIILSVLYIFSLFLSFLIAPRLLPALDQLIVTVLHIGFFLYVIEEFYFKTDLKKLVCVLSVSVLLVSILGLVQWLKQGSVFNNYLFFGEQPYTYNTTSIVKEYVFNRAMIPPYATFRHPNILAAFLSISLIVIIANIGFFKRRFYWWFVVALGALNIFLSWSKITWFCFAFSLALLFLFNRFGKKILLPVLALSGAAILALNLLPLTHFDNTDPSLYMRGDLINASVKLIAQHPLFGVGLNNITVFISNYLTRSEFLKFIQPVHNIFLLLLTESGFFSALLFVALISYVVYKTVKSAYLPNFTGYYLVITLFQLVFLGSFDHYFLTITQTSLLFWLTLGICMKYNLSR
jgi:O-antigen ligase